MFAFLSPLSRSETATFTTNPNTHTNTNPGDSKANLHDNVNCAVNAVKLHGK